MSLLAETGIALRSCQALFIGCKGICPDVSQNAPFFDCSQVVPFITSRMLEYCADWLMVPDTSTLFTAAQRSGFDSVFQEE